MNFTAPLKELNEENNKKIKVIFNLISYNLNDHIRIILIILFIIKNGFKKASISLSKKVIFIPYSEENKKTVK